MRVSVASRRAAVSASEYVPLGVVMTKPSGDPFQDMCTMIGVMTISWAWCENGLAIAIAVIDANRLDGVSGRTSLPISLSKKLDYLKTALREIPALEGVEKDGTLLVQMFSDLKHRRHSIIHGSLWSGRAGSFENLNIKSKGRLVAPDQQPIDIADVIRLNIEIKRLSDVGMTFLRKINVIYP